MGINQKAFLQGISTGFLLQLAIGPVFFLILNITLQRTLIDGLFSVLAVTAADYIYILLAIAGVGRLLENEKIKVKLGIAGSIILILFGIYIIYSAVNSNVLAAASGNSNSNYSGSFVTAFLLTISSPLTIVFWTGLFAAKAIEKNYKKEELFIFGFSAGLATLLFLGISVLLFSLIKTSIPAMLMVWTNGGVGIVLIVYGVSRIIKIIS